MGADGVFRRATRTDFALFGERQARDVIKATCRGSRIEARRFQLIPIELRAFKEIVELRAIMRIINDELLRPWAGFNFRSEHHALASG
jgi:hypothetical protein